MRHEQYDAVVIGAREAGGTLAVECARAGLHTALLEGFESPWDCADSGCLSSMSLIASANVARLARKAHDFGIETGNIEVDFSKVQMRKRAVVDGMRSQSVQALHDTPGLTAMKADARFCGADRLIVRQHDDALVELEAPRIFINTGARPSPPKLSGLSGVPYLTAGSATELEELPDHLLVLGGGYLGVELAQIFSRLGSRVSIVERQGQLLPREDRDIAATVAEILREDGVDVFLETEAAGVTGDSAGARLLVRTPFGERVLSGSRLLVAAGREPNTDGLDLSAAGIAVDDRGYIKVNEHLETNVQGVYALAGVNGGPMFTQSAQDDLRIIRANVIEKASGAGAARTYRCRTFIDPPLARIGLTEWEAREQGRRIKIAKLPMNRITRAVESGETRGMVKVVVDADTDRVIGAAVLGTDSGEFLVLLQIAMMADMPYTSMRDGMFAHLSPAGPLNDLFATMDG